MADWPYEFLSTSSSQNHIKIAMDFFFLMYEHTRTKKEKRRGDQNTEENSSNSYKPEETGGW